MCSDQTTRSPSGSAIGMPTTSADSSLDVPVPPQLDQAGPRDDGRPRSSEFTGRIDLADDHGVALSRVAATDPTVPVATPGPWSSTSTPSPNRRL